MSTATLATRDTQAPAAALPVRRSRNVGIDCLRGLAILLVVVHHLALPFRLPLGPSLLGEWLPKRLVDAISFNGYEAVFVFFVISGFLIATRIIDRDGSLECVDLRRFYAARARRILPLLGLVLAVLSILALSGVPGFAPEGEQSTAGLLASALTFTFNLYEGRTGWAPAGWDVLWSLSIEEAFYLGFPLLCLWLPRRLLVGVLLLWALALSPLRDLVPPQDEVWREKAYLPGMAAIAWGVLAALLARRWSPSRGQAQLMAVCGALCLVLTFVWGDFAWRHLYKSNLYWLCIGACLLLLAFYAHPPAPRRGLGWLARMGELSYELYLAHMFVVLGVVAGYRALLGEENAWTFVVYLPVLLLCRLLAGRLEGWTTRFQPRRAASEKLPPTRLVTQAHPVKYAASLLLALAAYLCLWPVPIQAQRWHPAPAPAPAGPFAPNTGLAAPHRIDLQGEIGPEHVLAAPDGSVYVGVASGRILRLADNAAVPQLVADTGGRPLGLAFDGAGNLLVADARKGLLSIAPDGKATVLLGLGEGALLSFPNAIAVARSGIIYVSDSSQRFTAVRWGSTQEAALLDIMEQSATGRVIAFDPATRKVRVVVTGLSLANGIALTSDEEALLVSESGRYRVWKINVHAQTADIKRQGANAQVLLDNLPGYPDNLTRGRDGRIWLGLAGPRNDSDAVASYPFLRELALRLPRRLLPQPPSYGHVLAFTEDGTIVEDLQDPARHAPTITGLTETGTRRYLHNVDAGMLSWVDGAPATPAQARSVLRQPARPAGQPAAPARPAPAPQTL